MHLVEEIVLNILEEKLKDGSKLCKMNTNCEVTVNGGFYFLQFAYYS